MIDRHQHLRVGRLVAGLPVDAGFERQRRGHSGRWMPVERSCVAAPHMRWYMPTGGVMSRRATPPRQNDCGKSTWARKFAAEGSESDYACVSSTPKPNGL